MVDAEKDANVATLWRFTNVQIVHQCSLFTLDTRTSETTPTTIHELWWL